MQMMTATIAPPQPIKAPPVPPTPELAGTTDPDEGLM